jgi:hypothetical protein
VLTQRGEHFSLKPRITPQREEYLLDHVLGQLLVGADPAGQRVAEPDETLIELG